MMMNQSIMVIQQSHYRPIYSKWIKNGGDATVTVTSSDNWRLSGICDWAHPSITSGKDGDVVTFTIDPNKLDEKRTATFKFFTGSSVVPLQVESQPAYIMDLLSDEALSITKEKSTVRIQLNTNVADPTITYSDGGEEWLTFDRRNEFGGKVTLSFTAAENKTYKDRSTKITISSPLVTESVNVDINQKQTDAIITESNTLTYDLTARTISFKVKYNVNYAISITKGKDWITDQSISEPQKGDDGLTTVTVTYNYPHHQLRVEVQFILPKQWYISKRYCYCSKRSGRQPCGNSRCRSSSTLYI